MNPRSQSSRKAASCAKAVRVGSCLRGDVLGGSSRGAGATVGGHVPLDVAVRVGLLEAHCLC
jgi:hypothetical protein